VLLVANCLAANIVALELELYSAEGIKELQSMNIAVSTHEGPDTFVSAIHYLSSIKKSVFQYFSENVRYSSVLDSDSDIMT
jgi:hypothetical protein